MPAWVPGDVNLKHVHWRSVILGFKSSYSAASAWLRAGRAWAGQDLAVEGASQEWQTPHAEHSRARALRILYTHCGQLHTQDSMHRTATTEYERTKQLGTVISARLTKPNAG